MLCIIVLGRFSSSSIFMDFRASTRAWTILCSNIRGINSEGKWESIRNKISESSCDVVSLQETKRDSFDISYIRKFCPRSFDSFCFLPSIRASGGILVVWKSSILSGTENFQNNYAISVEFCSVHNDEPWILTSIYAPYDADGKVAFIN